MRNFVITVLFTFLVGCSAATFNPEGIAMGAGAILQNGEVETCEGPFNGVVEFAKIDSIDLQEEHGFTPAGKASYEVESGKRNILLALRCTPEGDSLVYTAFAVVRVELSPGETYRIKESHQGLVATLWVVDSAGQAISRQVTTDLQPGMQGVNFEVPSTE